jgi:hypothetical protein
LTKVAVLFALNFIPLPQTINPRIFTSVPLILLVIEVLIFTIDVSSFAIGVVRNHSFVFVGVDTAWLMEGGVCVHICAMRAAIIAALS